MEPVKNHEATVRKYPEGDKKPSQFTGDIIDTQSKEG